MSSNFFHISYSFCPILTKLGTRDLCATMQKNCGTDIKFVAGFLNIKFGLQQQSCLCRQAF